MVQEHWKVLIPLAWVDSLDVSRRGDQQWPRTEQLAMRGPRTVSHPSSGFGILLIAIGYPQPRYVVSEKNWLMVVSRAMSENGVLKNGSRSRPWEFRHVRMNVKAKPLWHCLLVTIWNGNNSILLFF